MDGVKRYLDMVIILAIAATVIAAPFSRVTQDNDASDYGYNNEVDIDETETGYNNTDGDSPLPLVDVYLGDSLIMTGDIVEDGRNTFRNVGLVYRYGPCSVKTTIMSCDHGQHKRCKTRRSYTRDSHSVLTISPLGGNSKVIEVKVDPDENCAEQKSYSLTFTIVKSTLHLDSSSKSKGRSYLFSIPEDNLVTILGVATAVVIGSLFTVIFTIFCVVMHRRRPGEENEVKTKKYEKDNVKDDAIKNDKNCGDKDKMNGDK